MTLPEVIGHRGMPRQAREHMLAPFAPALDAGADTVCSDLTDVGSALWPGEAALG